MSAERPLRVFFYWGGQIHYHEGSVHYFPPACNRSVKLRHRVSYDELVDKIYEYMGVDKGNFKLKIFLRQPCGRFAYAISPVVDDETLEDMYDLWRETNPYIAEIYIKKEEIVPIPSAQNVGPMMSLFNACTDPMRVHRPPHTAVPETASASHHTLREFVSTSLQHVGAARRLALCPPPIPHDIPRHVDPRRVKRAPQNVGGGQHGGGRRRRVQSLEHVFQTDASRSSMATKYHCGGSTVLTPQSLIMQECMTSRSPVTFQEFTTMENLDVEISRQWEGGREQTETRTDDLHDQQATHESHTTQVTPVVQNLPRRGARTRRRRECGTGGHILEDIESSTE